FNREIFPGIQGGPLMHVIAAKAVAFKEALDPSFRDYQRLVVQNARSLAGHLTHGGLNLVSGGTDTHLMLLDLTSLDLTGKDAETALERAGITVNKNMVPSDTRGPFVTSGVRIGTPCLTTRGMGVPEMASVADLILRVLRRPEDRQVLTQVRAEVRALCEAFPLYRA
ncbi:MAG: serine hydroxymethyltransferase, partial [Desulfobacterales bacterium]|nr:serine hydroxymethyltransferase [Desulfobacterales bacterium]